MADASDRRRVVSCTIDRFEGEDVVLRTSNKEEMVVPKSLLSSGARKGGAFVITFEAEEDHAESQNQTAKDILNELLGKS